VLQRRNYSLLIFCGDVVISVKGVDDERKGRRMRQHVSRQFSAGANKGETQMGCGLEHDVSPSTADLYKVVPPPFAAPIPSIQVLAIVDLAFA
jgi:hypothetical protein